MPVTGLRGRQILDGDVLRADLNTSTAGSAVITKIIAGTNISISSTGVDAGTGDVTINATGTGLNGTGFVRMAGTTVSYITGTSSQFVKADGSLDSSLYLTSSSLSSYVPYIGATTSLNLGANNITAQNYLADGNNTTTGGYFALRQYSGSNSGVPGYTSLYAITQNSLYIRYSQTDGSQKNVELSSALLGTTIRQYLFPNASGTFALTSDIPTVAGVYLPLSGGTLTGALGGTTATFNGGAVLSTAVFSNTSNDGGIDVINSGTLASGRTSQVRLVNGTTFFGANDRTYQLVNIGTGTTQADFYIQYFNGSSYFDRFRIASTGAATFSSSVTAGGNITTSYAGPSRMIVESTTNSNNAGIYFAVKNSSGIGSQGGVYYIPTATPYLTLSGDNSSTHLNVTQTGLVGIGTTSPSAKLTVSGTQVETHINNGDTNTLTLGGFSGGRHFIKSINLGVALTPLTLQASSFTFDTGNVGIGTTNPGQLLTIQNTSSNPYLSIIGGASATMGVLMGTTGNTVDGQIIYSNSTQHMAFVTASAERMRITSGGRLLLGLTSDFGYLLSVNGTSYFQGAALFNSTVTAAKGYFSSNAATDSTTAILGNASTNDSTTFAAIFGSLNAGYRMHVRGDGQLRLHTYTSSSAWTGTAVATLGVDSSGNVITVTGGGGSSQWITSGSDIYYSTGRVGIGSTGTPLTNLDVRLATTDNVNGTVLNSYPIASFIANGSGGGQRGLQIGAPTGSINSPVFLKVFGTSARFAIVNQSNVENFTVLEGGSVGIGIASPVTNLHIASNTNTGIRINATASNGSAEIDLLSHGTQNAFIDYGPNQLRFRSTNSDMSAIINQSVLVLQNDGNVGIGTASPNALLNIVTTAAGEAFIFRGSGSKEFVSINHLGFIRTRASDTNGANMHFFDNGGTKRMEMAVGSTAMTWYSDALAANFITFQHTTGNIGLSVANPGVRLDVSGAIRSSTSVTAPQMYGTSYSTLTSGAGTGTAVFDTLSTTGAGAYEVVIVANPNAGGSSSYADWYIGKLVIGTGFNGSAVVHYIDFIQESPMPRTLFGSGGGDLTVTAVFNNSGTESEEASNGATYTIRFRISGYNSSATGANTTIYLKKIGT